MTSKPEIILFLSDARGIYIPRDFATSIKRECVSGISAGDWEVLENPDHEWYWETWDSVLNNAVITDDKGNKYHVYQDGDCWLVPHGMVWDEGQDFFHWPSDDADEDEDEE